MQKMLIRGLGFAAAAVVTVSGATLSYLYLRKPEMAPPLSIRVEMTPERIARGKYVYALADCDGCHSERDFSRLAGPVMESGRGKGVVFPPELGLPGRIVASNITTDRETGLGAWTDGEKIRAIREGISRDGRALFPLMPYENYRHMSDEDVFSLVAYLNTLPPIRHRLPKSEVKLPASLLMKDLPRPVRNVPQPDRSDPVRYGEYLATVGVCADCHTQRERGSPKPGMRFAGGERFHFGFATVVSSNITPDEKTGIGRWSERAFLARFYAYRDYAQKGSPQAGPQSFTLMPWLALSQLPPEDLRAIYAYLRAQPPVFNPVTTHPRPGAEPL